MTVELICGDCLDVLKTFPDASADVVITDPPYCSGGVSEASRSAAKGQGLRSENLRRFGWFVGDNMTTTGLVWLLRSVAIECRRVCKDTASVLMFCDWRMLHTLVPPIESAGLRYQNLVVWDKGHFGLGRGFRCQHELVMHFTCGAPAYYDRATGNVLSAKRVGKDEREHQTQKPVDLIDGLLRVVAPEGATVLDPFMGSGTTGVACVQTGRNFIGIEIDPTYYAIAERRIAEAQAQLALPMMAAAHG